MSPPPESAAAPRLETPRLSLSATHRALLRQFTRYLLVGGIAFLMDFGSLYLLTELGRIHYLYSAGIAFLIGLLTNYGLCRIWVFDHRSIDNVAMEFTLFAVIGIIGLGANEGILWLFTEKVHVHYLFAKAVSAAVVLLWNFGARKALLFR